MDTLGRMVYLCRKTGFGPWSPACCADIQCTWDELTVIAAVQATRRRVNTLASMEEVQCACCAVAERRSSEETICQVP
jgi:hypothetical protein